MHDQFDSPPDLSSESLIEIDTGDRIPALERLQQRRHTGLWQIRAILAGALSGSTVWLTAGAFLFGNKWLESRVLMLLAACLIGAFLGALVVVYTIWVEINAAMKGKVAVWNYNESDRSLFSFLRLKIQFAVVTMLALACLGVLMAAVASTMGDLEEDITRGGTLLTATLAIAIAFGLVVRSISRLRN